MIGREGRHNLRDRRRAFALHRCLGRFVQMMSSRRVFKRMIEHKGRLTLLVGYCQASFRRKRSLTKRLGRHQARCVHTTQVLVLGPFERLVEIGKHFEVFAPVRPEIDTSQCNTDVAIRVETAEDQQDTFGHEQPVDAQEGFGSGKVDATDQSVIDDEEADWVLIPCCNIERATNEVLDRVDRTEEEEALKLDDLRLGSDFIKK